jgi:protease-4
MSDFNEEEQALEPVVVAESEKINESAENSMAKQKKSLPHSSKKGLIVLGVIGVIGICVFIFNRVQEAKAPVMLNQNFFSIYDSITNSNSATKISAKTDYIAVLYIEGTIEEKNKTYDQQWLLDTIYTLQDDYKNNGILLFINSPGGGVYESDEVYLALMDYKDQTGRPIVAYFGSMAASGGYYIGCAADEIYANRNTLTGSIGVIAGQVIDVTDFLSDHGIQVHTFTAGKNKAMLSLGKEITPEHRDIMLSVANECYEQFVEIVADSRTLPLETVKQIADGRIYTAKQALANGLIDSIGSFDDAITFMEDEYFDGTDMYIEHLEVPTKINFYDYFKSYAEAFSNAMTSTEQKMLEAVKNEVGLPDTMSYPAYYFSR